MFLQTGRGYAASVKISENELWFLGGEEVNNLINWSRTTEVCTSGAGGDSGCVMLEKLLPEGVLKLQALPFAIKMDDSDVLVGNIENE